MKAREEMRTAYKAYMYMADCKVEEWRISKRRRSCTVSVLR